MKKFIFVFLILFCFSTLISAEVVYSGTVTEMSTGITPWVKLSVQANGSYAVVRVAKQILDFVQSGDNICVIHEDAFYVLIDNRKFLVYTLKIKEN